MRAFLALLVAVFLAAAPSAASAAEPNPCGVDGWFVNDDEANRAPERTRAGFVFDDADLIHHAAPAGLTTKALSAGHYLATPAPDQPSFFSVEVSGTDGGYATLRYNRTTHTWTMVTGGQLYENADPDALVDMPPVHRSHTVVRFGVGYTANPPGTVTTTVRSVSFLGKAYVFSCPAPTATTTPSTTPSASASSSTTPSSSASASASPTRTATPSRTTASATISPAGAGEATNEPDDALPVTGVSALGLLAAGALMIATGLGGIVLARRRNRTP